MPRTSDRRDLIVDLARVRFTERGYDGTTIGDLAGELGISKAAIAYYFPTKDRFLDEFVTPFLDVLEAAVVAADDARAVVEGYLGSIVDFHEIAVWMDTDPAIQNHPDFGGRLDRINAKAMRKLTGGSRRTADKIRATGVLGGIWRPARSFSSSELGAHRDQIVDDALASF